MPPDRSLRGQCLLLRQAPGAYSWTVQSLINPQSKGPLFNKIEVAGGSIGTSLARLWKGEVSGAILKPGFDTPWDLWPIIGISQQMGFMFLRPKMMAGHGFEPYNPVISCEITNRPHETLIIHQSRVEELTAWQNAP